MEKQRGGGSASGVLTAMDGEHLEERRYIPRTGGMFSRGSLAKAEMATDLAIPIVAEGGWPALTLRNVARAANVTPQAIAAWFPSVGAMRVAVAARYGDRWICERGYLARWRTLSARAGAPTPTVPAAAAALLPQSWLEATYDGIWTSIVEAGRWDEAIGNTVAGVHEQEEDLARGLLDPSGLRRDTDLEVRVELTLALVRGLRGRPWQDP